MHTGGQRHLLGLARRTQALIERRYRGSVPTGHQSRHGERRAHPRAPSPDDASAPPGAARPRSRRRGARPPPRRQSPCDRLAIELAEFGQFGQQSQGRRGTDARNTAQQVLSFAPHRTGLHPLAQRVVEIGQLLLQPGEMAPAARRYRRESRVKPLALGSLHPNEPNELAPTRHERRQFLRLRIRQGARQGARRGVDDVGWMTWAKWART